MTKGLIRSLRRANPRASQTIQKKRYSISGSLDITGVDSAVDAGTFVIGALPQGNILLLGAVAYVGIAAEDEDVIRDWEGDFGIGFAPNADLDLGDVLEDAVIPSTAVRAATSTKTVATLRATSTTTEQGAILDNTDGSLELNFNLLIDDNVITDTRDGTFAVSGHLWIAYAVLGDD